MVRRERIYHLKASRREPGNVIYWMSRDQRHRDNWALIHASDLAKELNTEFAVVFCLTSDFPGATIRHYTFMLEGLREVSQNLQLLNIPFYLLQGDPVNNLDQFISEHNVSHVVTDFDPLHIKKAWKNRLAEKAEINLIEVDAHNIVPARFVSQKQEYGAYTLRPKIKRHLENFLEAFPALETQAGTSIFKLQQTNWTDACNSLKVNRKVPVIDWIHPGEDAAFDMLGYFNSKKLQQYNSIRNNPNEDGTSNLSPYLHFGQISAQRIALEVMNPGKENPENESFLEELIVRKELADNYCHYNEKYDTLNSLPSWAHETLEDHKNDKREFIYSLDEFEAAKTHEPLWNAAQNELVITGKMHGYMRMYWAKKILEWTETPEQALKFSIFMNDKYGLDGRDPNGYTGCAWAIGGVHDRPWKEREIFGKIRYMNFNGARRKFDTDTYIARWI